MLLSLDISTSTVGYSIFDKNLFNAYVLLDIGYIDLGKHKGLYEKATYVKSALVDITKNYNIESIAVEENLQAYRPGLSSAKTLMTLAQFNGVVRWICYESLKVDVVSMNVNTARKLVGLKINRKSEKNTKQQDTL